MDSTPGHGVESIDVRRLRCAGRMIRRPQDLAETREIRGTDISSEHIYWCRQNLSPPFNLATTTKTPYLPSEAYFYQTAFLLRRK